MQCDCGQETKNLIPAFPWHCACGAKWLNCNERLLPCVHLGEATGGTFWTRTGCACKKDHEVAVRRCAIHGVTLLRPQKHVPNTDEWGGVDCLTCDFRETTKKPVGAAKHPHGQKPPSV